MTNPQKKSGCLGAMVGAFIGFWVGPITYMIWKDRRAPDPFSSEGIATLYGIMGSIIGIVIGALVGAVIGKLKDQGLFRR